MLRNVLKKIKKQVKELQKQKNVEMDSINDTNLLFQIKNEQSAVAKINLIKQFKELGAIEKVKVMKEYNQMQGQGNTTNSDTPNLDTLVDFVVNMDEKITIDEFDNTLTDEVISKADEEAEENEEAGKRAEEKIKAKREELSKKLTANNIQTDSISFDSIKLEMLSELLDKLFIDKSLSDDKRLEALEDTQRLINTDIEAKRKLEDMIDDLAFDNDNTLSLF